MDNSIVKISSSWTHIGGCLFSQAFKLFPADPDIFNRPDLNEIVDEEKSLLLTKADSSENCELFIELYSEYKIQSVSLVCNVSKIEIFFGPIKEYLQTVHGVITDDSDDQFKSYRYDIEVERSGITNLVLKFLTHSSDVCIFGIILYIAPNPNGITTLLPNTNSYLNTANIQNKQLLEVIKNTKILSNPTNSNSETFKGFKNLSIDDEKPSSTRQLTNDVISQLKFYIDERFKEVEERLKRRLDIMEERQMHKLDDILARIQQFK
ncbi:hypothetical protein DOY81_003276 [Sarcophaga bullata]|nr:hypothetical protein DOY81_003276 [Sarcophaga bullata]